MPSVTHNLAKFAGVFGFVALTSTVAFGLPWDIDMADAQSVKAYEYEMMPLPEGVVNQPNMLTPTNIVANYALNSPDGNALVNPLDPTPDVMRQGERMYEVYCTPCHGDGVVLGSVSKAYPGIAVLAGDAPAARLKKLNDGQVYLTIRNGKGLMQKYDWAMSESERWALVHYLRTLPDSQYLPPPPPSPAPEPEL